jgi:hypothetical protein
LRCQARKHCGARHVNLAVVVHGAGVVHRAAAIVIST